MRALDGLSLEVRSGAWLALLGPNGAGKSTLMRLLATLEQPDEGSVEVLGAPSNTAAASIRGRLGVVFQRPGLDALLTVRENLMMQAALMGMGRAAASQRTASIATDMGLSDRLDDRVGTLSGGLARRADLARALVQRPALLLLDEPTTGLDHDSREAFLSLLERTRAEAGDRLTVVMSTHLMDEAERADEVAMISAGRIVAEGSPAALRNDLGERIVSCPAECRAVLEQAGLAVRSAPGAWLRAVGDEGSIERAASALVRAGAPFSIGPPTLGDAYLALTGAALSATDDGGAE